MTIDVVIDAACIPADLAEFFEPVYPNAVTDTWRIAPKPYRGAHFVTMPIDLAERCIWAGSRPSDTVLDPFGGAGTTAIAASRNGRKSILIELNPDYVSLARRRIAVDEMERANGQKSLPLEPAPRVRACVTHLPKTRVASNG
jgi:DNA modification methylase